MELLSVWEKSSIWDLVKGSPDHRCSPKQNMEFQTHQWYELSYQNFSEESEEFLNIDSRESSLLVQYRLMDCVVGLIWTEQGFSPLNLLVSDLILYKEDGSKCGQHLCAAFALSLLLL